MDVTAVVMACKSRALKEGLSLASVARRVGVSKGQVGNWWNKRRIPSAENLLALIDAVGLSFQLGPGDRVEMAAKTTSAAPIKPMGTKTRGSKYKLPPLAVRQAARALGVCWKSPDQEDCKAAIAASIKEAEAWGPREVQLRKEQAAEFQKWIEASGGFNEDPFFRADKGI